MNDSLELFLCRNTLRRRGPQAEALEDLNASAPRFLKTLADMQELTLKRAGPCGLGLGLLELQLLPQCQKSQHHRLL